MSDIIDLNEQRSKNRFDELLKEPSSERPATVAGIRFNNAFAIFAMCSSIGKKRQRDFLYQILCDFRFERRTISLEEMGEKMISYIHRRRNYFEKKAGNPIKFDFDTSLDIQGCWRQLNIGVPKRRKAHSAGINSDE